MAKPKNKLQASDSHWFLFLILPLFAGFTAIRNYKAPWAKNVIWAFIVFYGFTFAVAKEAYDADITRYIGDLKELYGKSLSISDMVEVFKDSGEADVLRISLAILISRFTDSAQVLTAVYGFIFGFFFSRNIWYIIEHMKGKLKWISILLIVTFFLTNPFWNINGFRFNTAVLMFIYGIFPYLYEGKKSRLFVSYLALLVHFSFLFPIMILTGYLALGNRKNFFFGFFIVSIFISNINVTEFNTLVEANVPEIFLERSKHYRDEDRVESFRQNDDSVIESQQGVEVAVNWYALYYLRALHFSLMAILIALYFFGKKVLQENKFLNNGYCFSLFFFGFANLLISLPSGERFLMIASLSTLALVIFYLQNQVYERFVTNVTLMAVPAILLFCVVALRTGLYSVSINTLIGNPVMSIFTDYNLSLNDLIK